MKKITGLLLCILYINNLQSQGFVKAEYFFDNDPGIDNATTISLGNNSDSINFIANIATASLFTGFHYLGLRIQHNNDGWGLTEVRNFYISTPTTADVADITAAEYFFNTDPGPGNGTPINIGSSGPNVTFSIAIPTSVGIGFHNLSIRTKDADGNWGMFETKAFYISSPPSTDATDIVAAEYFFNTDPGPGNATPVSIGASGAIISFNAAIPVNLGAGFHYIAIRTKDADGKWGIFESRSFYISSPPSSDVLDITAAEYFIDTDPGIGNASPLTIGNSGSPVNFNASIPVNLSPGFHLLSIRTKDQSGNWGLFETHKFYVKDAPAPDMQVITSAEYYFDNDPGIGKANPLAIPTSGDIINLMSSIPVPCLGTGQHFLAIRVRDQQNNWGLFGFDTLTITSGLSAAQVTPVGPLAICSTDSAVLSSANVAGINYQWLLNGLDIPGATKNTFAVRVAGSYSLKTFCNSSFVVSNTVVVSILPDVIAGTINGSAQTCEGTILNYISNGTPGGSWSSSNSSVATVNSTSGSITAISPGTTLISYTITSGCGSPVSVQKELIVLSNSMPGTITGPSSLCIGLPTSYSSNGETGGQWSSNNTSILTINQSTGFANGQSAGSVTISYTITNSPCPKSSQFIITVDPNANAGTISGTTNLCIGQMSGFQSNGNVGGHWTSDNELIATVNATTGVVNAINPGSTTIRYHVEQGCNNPVSSFKNITVNENVNAGVVSGLSFLCKGQSTTYTSNGTSGGSWTTTNPTIANINSTTGLLTALTGGTVEVIYTIQSGCGSPVSSSLTVELSPLTVGNSGTISGTSTLCIIDNATYSSNGDTGGSWSSSNLNVASINSSTGQINPIAPGSVIISYSVNGCLGIVTSQKTVSIIGLASAGNITGASLICTGGGAAYFTNGTVGGTWLSSNPNVASIQTNTGFVNGLSKGTTIITYTVSGCGGTFNTPRTITVDNSVNAGTITGVTSICENESTTFTTNGSVGGTWTSNNTGVATINSNSGHITALNPGTVTMSYSISGCNGTRTTSRQLSVVAITTAGIISGANNLCIGISANYSSSGAQGGTWSSSNQSVATINPITGIVNTIGAGIAIINYSVSACSNTFNTSHQLNVSGHTPTFSFSGNTNFTNEVVFPKEGEPTFSYRFEIKYTDIDGNLPAAGFPRMMLDFEGNGIFTDKKDMNIIMTALNPSDQNVTDGKIYFVVLSGLPLNKNWKVHFSARESSGCDTESTAFDGPNINTPPNLNIFADGISFSNSNPTPSSTITVFAEINNDSEEPIQNFFVHLINQYDPTQNYPDIIVSEIAAKTTMVVSWNITTPVLEAWVPMQVVVDYTENIDELNELDNQAIRPFTNGNFTVPGRIKITASGSSTTCQSSFYTVCGRAIYENTAVTLQNKSVAGANVLVTIRETGQSFSSFTNTFGDYCVSFISPFDIAQFTLDVTVTDFTISGDTSSAFRVVYCPPPSNDGPDLNSLITLDRSEVFVGEAITGTVTIKNIGNRIANINSCEVSLESTGPSQIISSSTPLLNPGESYTTSFSLVSSFTNSTDHVISKADAQDVISELSEHNNTDNKQVRICPLQSDLSVLGPIVFTAYPVVYMCDSKMSFSINNYTCIPVNQDFDIQLQVFQNSTLVYNEVRRITTDIARDNGIGFGFENIFPAGGTYTVKFTADINNEVAEFNESNNSYSSLVGVIECKADLAIGSGCSPVIPADPARPGNITVNTTVTNGGRVDAVAPIIVDFEVNGNHYPVTITNNIPAGGSIPVAATFPTPVYGCPKVTAVVDATDLVDEYNEGDTSKINLSWDFKLGRQCYEFDSEDPRPNPNFWEEPHNVGEPVALAVGIQNLSTYSASSVHTRFEVSGPFINGWLDLGFANTLNVSQSCSRCKTSYDIAPHEVTLPNSFVFPEVGVYQVRMTADFDTRYTECNETNNEMIVEVTITNNPDYRSLSKFIAPSLLNPEVGEPITIDVTYQNVGASNIVDSLDILLKIDDLPHQRTRVKGLLNGSTSTAHFNNKWASLKAGLHVIRAVVDVGKEIKETDEFNNEATRSFVVGKAADLYFKLFLPDNSFPVLGQTITLNTKIGNHGALASEADVEFFYINDNQDTIFIGIQHINVNAYDSVSLIQNWIVLDNSTTLIARIVNMDILQIQYDNKIATALLDNIAVQIASTPACYGGHDGTLTASMIGGNAPFTFNWSNGTSGASLLAPPGTYTVTVVDAAGVARINESRIQGMHAPSFFEDFDGDGFGNPNSIIEDCVQPIGYVVDYTDCNDRNLNVFPGATEVCNYIDDNCDGQIDEGVKLRFFVDEDGDGYGNPDVYTEDCTLPIGYVLDSTDCNDAVNSAHPGAIEVCNGIDDDCDNLIDEGLLITFYRDADGDGFGNPNATTQDCSVTSGFVTDNTDCNDDPLQNGANTYPAATEICNGWDDNCNGVIDENVKLTFYRDADADGYGNPAVKKLACSAPLGYVTDNSDCNDQNAAIHPAETEICNGIDDNCNGFIDDNDPGINGQSIWFLDSDGDGHGNPLITILACNQAVGYINNNTDCDDSNLNIHPLSAEQCNGIDDNCDDVIDEGCNTCDITVNAGTDEWTYYGFTNYETSVHTATLTGGTAPFTYNWTLSRPLKCNVSVATGDEIFSGGNCTHTNCPSGNNETTLSQNASCSGSQSITLQLMDTAVACVTVTDANGCSATDCFTIFANDSRCYAGNSQNHKVIICHATGNTKNPWVELCIDESALATHLAHGDYIGKCNTSQGSNRHGEVLHDLIVYPNPVQHTLYISFTSHKFDNYDLQLTDITGRKVLNKKHYLKEGSALLEIPVKDYAKGVYILSVMGSEGSKHVRVVVE